MTTSTTKKIHADLRVAIVSKVTVWAQEQQAVSQEAVEQQYKKLALF